MKDQELTGLLRRAADELPEPDLVGSTWTAGRAARRRRWGTRAVGALAACGVVGVLGLQVAGGPGMSSAPTSSADGTAWTLEPAGPAGPPSAERVLEAPPGGEGREEVLRSLHRQGLEGQTAALGAREVWATVYGACLESRGYTVDDEGPGLSVTQQGAFAGDYERDLAACRAELVTDAPVVAPPFQELRREDRSLLTGRYFEYYWTWRCLTASDVPAGELMQAAEFVPGLAWSQLPPWHPYLEAAAEGRYAEARQACPIGRP